MLLKKLSLLFAALLTATVMNLHAVDITSWTIAGSVSLMGSQWDYSDTKNDMKLVKGSYELKKFVYLAESSYEYIAVANHTSGVKDIPESGTQVLDISADGDYIVTFTLDAAGTTLTADAELYTSEDALVDTYVNDESMGSVTGAGEYAIYGQVTLTATPNDGYKFVNWSGDQTGTDNPLSFTVNTLYTAVQANFEAETPTGPDMHDFLYFVGLNGNDTVRLDKMRAESASTFEYSMDRKTWLQVTWTTASQTHKKGNPIALNQGDTVFFRAKGVDGKNATVSTENAYFSFFFGVDDSIAVGGNIMSLYDATCEQDTMTAYGFYYLFNNKKKLVSASELKLPAKKLAHSCYESMFDNCIALKAAPKISAETAAKYSCYLMFRGCTSLTTAPALPATKMAENCYQQMFSGCTALTTAPELPATTLALQCYVNMFQNCTALTQAPELEATTLAKLCYYSMFSGCTSLQVDTCADGSCDGVKFNPTTTGDEPTNWGKKMFDGCKGTVTTPQLGGNYCIKEYVEPAPIYGRKVTKGNFGTICLDKQFIAMEGVEGLYVPSYMTPDTTTLYCVEMPLDSVKAGYSYIFKSNADSVTFFMEGEASGVHTHNYMKGNLEGDTELTPAMMDYMEGLYVLANNELVKPAVESVIKNNTAMIILIDVPTTKPASVAGRKMVAIGRNVPTGVEQVAGGRLQVAEKCMVNGQLVIIRDGKMFNAQGQEL